MDLGRPTRVGPRSVSEPRCSIAGGRYVPLRSDLLALPGHRRQWAVEPLSLPPTPPETTDKVSMALVAEYGHPYGARGFKGLSLCFNFRRSRGDYKRDSTARNTKSQGSFSRKRKTSKSKKSDTRQGRRRDSDLNFPRRSFSRSARSESIGSRNSAMILGSPPPPTPVTPTGAVPADSQHQVAKKAGGHGDARAPGTLPYMPSPPALGSPTKPNLGTPLQGASGGQTEPVEEPKLRPPTPLSTLVFLSPIKAQLTLSVGTKNSGGFILLSFCLL